MKIPSRRHTRAAAIVSGGFLLAAAVWSLIPGTEHAGEAARREAESGKIAQPSRAALSQWLQTSSDQIARRADDYELNAPRRRNELGEPEPFREQAISAAQMEVLRTAATRQVVRLDFFPDVGFNLRITGRQRDAGESKLFAVVQELEEDGQFSMSWMDQQTRGLLELPSRNRAYEILLLADGTFVAREWLYTDVLCARASADGKSADAGMPLPVAPAPAPLRSSDIVVPVLSSRPSAAATIYLDFDGEVVSGTGWLGGATINAQPARMNASQIEETWRRVANHFAPFDVNVTTDRAVYDNAPAVRKTHCVITPTKDARPSAGGVAYLGSFTDPSSLRKVCWTFVDQVPADSALVCSHEIGHTLGLNHHGRLAGGGQPADEYYSGHGTGGTGWGPFMGAPYGKNLLQWSRGEYAFADNSLQDDLAVMTTPARIPYIADDHGNGISNATILTSGVPVQGLVEMNTDSDYFRMVAGTGQQPLKVDLPAGTMLDAKLEVYDEGGQLISTVNPVDALAISTVMNFPTPRTIYLRVLGTGKGQVSGSGYSSYSSLGSFTLTAGSALPGGVASLTALAESESSVRLTWTAVAGATSYRVFRQGLVVTNVNALAYLDRGVAETNSYTYNVAALNAAGQGSMSAPAVVSTPTWLAANPLGVRVLSPSVATNASGSLVFSGQAGSALTNGLFWSNATTGQSGPVAVTGTDWSHAVPLSSGTNLISFFSDYRRLVGTNVVAYDTPANPVYSGQGAWTDGMQAGVGLLPWSLAPAAGAGTHTVANSYDSAGPTLVGSFYGWGMRSDAGGFAEAVRRFEHALSPSTVLRTSLDFNSAAGTNSAGFALGDGVVERLRLQALGSAPNYILTDASGPRDTGIPKSPDGFALEFTVEAGGLYHLALGTNRFSGTLRPGDSLTTLRLSNTASVPDETFYVGAIAVSSPVFVEERALAVAPTVLSTAGETDGIPDSWWMEYFGTTTGVSAGADDDGDGFTNEEEYRLGTHPLDANSSFRVDQIARVPDGLSVSWSAVPGKQYQIFVSPGLQPAAWQAEGPTITAQAGEFSVTRVVEVPGGNTYFLRVGLVP
jgi:hypothetical protein